MVNLLIQLRIYCKFSNIFSPEFADEPYKKRMSADGKHEITMATNYIGHCILNDELMDLLAKAGQDGDYARYDINIIVFKCY